MACTQLSLSVSRISAPCSGVAPSGSPITPLGPKSRAVQAQAGRPSGDSSLDGKGGGTLATARSMRTVCGASAIISAVSECPACMASFFSVSLMKRPEALGRRETWKGTNTKSPWRRRSSRAAISSTCGCPPWPLASSSLRNPARYTDSPISVTTASSVGPVSVIVPGKCRCSSDLP